MFNGLTSVRFARDESFADCDCRMFRRPASQAGQLFPDIFYTPQNCFVSKIPSSKVPHTTQLEVRERITLRTVAWWHRS